MFKFIIYFTYQLHKFLLPSVMQSRKPSDRSIQNLTIFIILGCLLLDGQQLERKTLVNRVLTKITLSSSSSRRGHEVLYEFSEWHPNRPLEVSVQESCYNYFLPDYERQGERGVIDRQGFRSSPKVTAYLSPNKGLRDNRPEKLPSNLGTQYPSSTGFLVSL